MRDVRNKNPTKTTLEKIFLVKYFMKHPRNVECKIFCGWRREKKKIFFVKFYALRFSSGHENEFLGHLDTKSDKFTSCKKKFK